jgi:hypothetical protein
VILEPEAEERIAKLAGDLTEHGKELHQLAKANPNQNTLFNKYHQ